jgi:putative DNA primase/helicase
MRYYGTPIRVFLNYLLPNLVAVDQQLRDACQAFVREHSPIGASGETYRMADSFAVAAAAGEIATEAGVTGWHKGEATRAAARCLRDALTYRGGPGPADTTIAIARLRALVTIHGASRFQLLREAGERDKYPDRTMNRAGFRTTREANEQVYYIFKEVFREEVCLGTDPRTVGTELVRRRILIPDGNHFTRKVVLPGLGRQRVYTIVASRFEPE